MRYAGLEGVERVSEVEWSDVAVLRPSMIWNNSLLQNGQIQTRQMKSFENPQEKGEEKEDQASN